MKCYYHTDLEAVATCVVCGKAICQTCLIDVAGRNTCQHCLSAGKATRIQTQSNKNINPLAIISMVLGILGICTGILSVPAWITGKIAQKQIMENPNQEGMQLAQAGKILGMAITILWGVFLLCYGVFFVGAYLLALIEQASY